MDNQTSAVGICANALVLIGASPISDFNERSAEARACAILYPQVRDQALRAHPWACAIKRIILPPLVDTPAFGFRYAFEEPSDLVRVVSVNGVHDAHRIESNRILANTSEIQLVYVWANHNESSWDAQLSGYVTYLMASKLAYPLTKDPASVSAMTALAGAALRDARTTNAMEQGTAGVIADNLINARY